MRTGLGQFALPGDNAGFCDAILRKNGGQAQLRLESLTYVRPADREAAPQTPQQPLVVNLLMQLRTYYDQSNTFLRNQATWNLQLTNQLRQVLASSSGPVRLRAEEIEQAVRRSLYQQGEFKRAVDSLARELKKNETSAPELRAWLSGPGAGPQMAATAGRTPLPAAVQQLEPTRIQSPALQGTVVPNSQPVLPPLQPRMPQPQGEEAPEGKKRRGRRPAGQTATPIEEQAEKGGTTADVPAAGKKGQGKSAARRKSAARAPEGMPDGTELQAAAPKPHQAPGHQPIHPEGQPQIPEMGRPLAARQQPKPSQTHPKVPDGQSLQAAEQLVQAPAVYLPQTLTAELDFGQSRETAAAAQAPAEGQGETVLYRQSIRTGNQPGWAGRLHPDFGQMPSAFPTIPGLSLGLRGIALLGNSAVRSYLQSEAAGKLWPALIWRKEEGQKAASGGEETLLGTASQPALTRLSGNIVYSAGRNGSLRAQMAEGSTFSPGFLTAALSAAGMAWPVQQTGGGAAYRESRREPMVWRKADGESAEASAAPESRPAAPARLLPTIPQNVLSREGGAEHAGAASTAVERTSKESIGPARSVRWLERVMEGAADDALPKLLWPAALPALLGALPTMALGAAAQETIIYGGARSPVFQSGERAQRGRLWLRWLWRSPGAPAEGRAPWETQLAGPAARLLTTSPMAAAAAHTGLTAAVRHPSILTGLARPLSILTGTVRYSAIPTGNVRRPSIPAGVGVRQLIPARWFRLDASAPGGRLQRRSDAPEERDSRLSILAAPDYALLWDGTQPPPAAVEGVRLIVEKPSAGGKLLRLQHTVRGILAGTGKSRREILYRTRQLPAVMAALEPAPEGARRQGMPETADLPQTPGPGVTVQLAAVREERPTVPEIPLVRAVQPEVEVLPLAGGQPDRGQGGNPETVGPARTKIIYRQPERRPEPPAASGGDSGEAVLQAQTVTAEQAAAMSAAYSYPPGGGKQAFPETNPLTREEEERITRRLLEDINYNRMADEVLLRVERRLRAERRKFGR